MTFPAWEGARNCTGGPLPGATALLAWAREYYPQGRNMGIYNCRNVAGTATTSLHGEGRALDYGMPMTNGRGSRLGHEFVEKLRANARRLGIQAIIYDRQIWSARSPNGRAFTGRHPHYDHLHIELTWNSGRNLNLTTLRAVLGTGENVEALVRNIQKGLVDAGYDLGKWGPNNDGVDGRWGNDTQAGFTQAMRDARRQRGLTQGEADTRYVRKNTDVRIR